MPEALELGNRGTEQFRIQVFGPLDTRGGVLVRNPGGSCGGVWSPREEHGSGESLHFSFPCGYAQVWQCPWPHDLGELLFQGLLPSPTGPVCLTERWAAQLDLEILITRHWGSL